MTNGRHRSTKGAPTAFVIDVGPVEEVTFRFSDGTTHIVEAGALRMMLHEEAYRDEAQP